MVLSVDTSRPVKGAGARHALVAAVHEADEYDETQWLEWKLPVAFDKAEGAFAIAKQVLGMAKRDPERAAQQVGGYGYVLVGVEAGRVAGVSPVDPADLENRICRYVGVDGPRWDSYYVPYKGQQVLLVQVEPPRWGDPIHTLRKQFERWNEGAVFVRRRGGSHPASSAEIRMLEERSRRRAAVVDISARIVAGSEALPVRLDAAWMDERIEAERRHFLEPLDEPPREGVEDETPQVYEPGGDSTPIRLELSPELRRGLVHAQEMMEQYGAQLQRVHEAMRSHSLVGWDDEDRDEEAYRTQVDAYLDGLAEALPMQALKLWVESGRGGVEIELINNTDRNFDSVELELSFVEQVMAFEESEDVGAPEMPSPPRRWGPRSRLHHALFTQQNLDLRNLHIDVPAIPAFGIDIDNSRNDAHLLFDPVPLRPREGIVLPAFHVMAAANMSGKSLTGVWKATARDADGVAEGVIHVPVGDVEAPPHELCAPTSDG